MVEVVIVRDVFRGHDESIDIRTRSKNPQPETTICEDSAACSVGKTQRLSLGESDLLDKSLGDFLEGCEDDSSIGRKLSDSYAEPEEVEGKEYSLGLNWLD